MTAAKTAKTKRGKRTKATDPSADAHESPSVESNHSVVDYIAQGGHNNGRHPAVFSRKSAHVFGQDNSPI